MTARDPSRAVMCTLGKGVYYNLKSLQRNPKSGKCSNLGNRRMLICLNTNR